MTEANQSKGGGHASTQARRHTRSRNPGPLGNEASSGPLSRFYAWTASTPGWRAAEEEGVHVSLLPPLSNATAPTLLLSPNGHCP